jgi:DnaJ-class molecular chaperone
MSQTKCIQCDGLGYHYNQSTFQSEHCPHCEGKGVIEIKYDMGGPVESIEINTTTSVYNEEPVVETPKAPKKTTKAPVVETPVVEEPIIETPVSDSL